MGMQLMNSQKFSSTLQLRKFIIPVFILFSFVPIALIGWGIMKDEAFSFDSSAEMWVVNGLATCSTVFLVLAQIGSAKQVVHRQRANFELVDTSILPSLRISSGIRI